MAQPPTLPGAVRTDGGQPIDPALRYQMWVLRDMRTRDDLYRQRLSVPRLAYRPTISIVTPVYNTPPEILRRMLTTVQQQTYPHWQHCLVDDGSRESWIVAALERAAAADPRIIVRRRDRNGGIVAASNDALALATGDFVALLDHDDELHPEALFEVARLLNRQRDTDIIYSDCDIIETDGQRGHPFFFPDWSPELLLGLPYLVHLTVFRRTLIEQVGGFRPGLDGSQDYDLSLRATAVSNRIAHIPRVLYHWRVWSQSAARNPHAKPYAYAARRRATTDYMAAQSLQGELRDLDVEGYHTLKLAVRGNPLVNVVVPVLGDDDAGSTGLVARLADVLSAGGHARYDVTIVGPQGIGLDRSAWPEDAPLSFLPVGGARDAGAMLSAGAACGTGEHILALDADICSARDGWLSAMIELSQQEAIGVVGARIRTGDRAVWHAGIVVPKQGPRAVRTAGFLPANYLAVSGACLMTRREVFDAVGGFQHASTTGFADIDYCLRARATGRRVAFTPAANLVISRSATEDPYADDRDARARFSEHWHGRLDRDPYYNPNYTDDGRFVVRLD